LRLETNAWRRFGRPLKILLDEAETGLSRRNSWRTMKKKKKRMMIYHLLLLFHLRSANQPTITCVAFCYKMFGRSCVDYISRKGRVNPHQTLRVTRSRTGICWMFTLKTRFTYRIITSTYKVCGYFTWLDKVHPLGKFLES